MMRCWGEKLKENSMRIAIDASTISTQGGPRTYVLGLLDALLTIDRDNEYIVFYNDPVHLGRFPRAKEIVLEGRSPLARLWREHVLLPRACRKERVDLLHCPKSAIPYKSPCPTVVTLHDLIPLRHPETEKLAARIYWNLQMPIAARRSSFIITDSEHARQEIIEDFQVAPERIKVIMLGFNPAMLDRRDPVTAESVRLKYGLPQGYILYVGTIQPRKNIDTLFEAFYRLKQVRKDMPKLVIVGRKGWLYDKLFARFAELGLTDEVIFTGFVPDEDLPYIYDGARLFAYLSFFEGFGLPPLEAMACGIPVVTSNTTSLPEVVGDAGIAVPPADVDKVMAAIARILDDEGYSALLGQRGRERALLFSWEAAARETMAIYRQVAGNDDGR
jgi:glycosyltransferase involved in cell wall biosynthesis